MANCKKCGCELRIKNGTYDVAGDKDSDTVTQVFSVLIMHCINPNCSEKGKEIENRSLIYEKALDNAGTAENPNSQG